MSAGDPEAGTAKDATPVPSKAATRRPRRVAVIAAGCAALVFGLSLLELLVLPFHRWGFADATVRVAFDGPNAEVRATANPKTIRSWLHEVRVTAADCDVYATFEKDETARVARVRVESKGAAGWPVATREAVESADVAATVSDVDVAAARRLARAEEVAKSETRCDVVAETVLYRRWPRTFRFSGVGGTWERTEADTRARLRLGSPRSLLRSLSGTAERLRDALRLSLDETGALHIEWTEVKSNATLPDAISELRVSVPRVAYAIAAAGAEEGVVSVAATELLYRKGASTVIDLDARAAGGVSVAGALASSAAKTSTLRLAATALGDPDAFFPRLLGPSHVVAVRWARDDSDARRLAPPAPEQRALRAAPSYAAECSGGGNCMTLTWDDESEPPSGDLAL